ncbi:MAG TPA: TetR family transcriptional regulator [Bradyrhizobium sp.]|jgi:AcrR family transcriptional regulator|nr:TetR family transcriptional regulator [Bradyrhizobium sp.]
MRYDKGHKDATRQRIIDVASRQFRERGVAAVGLAGIMTDAGLTNGAFYAHFASKEDLLREVLCNARKRNEMWQAATESGAGLVGTIRDYLSLGHRDNPGRGCPTSALVAEIARHPKAARDAFTDKLVGIIELIAARLDSGTQRERRRKAVALYGLMVGTLQFARAVNDKRLSEEILQSGAEQALALVGQRGK